MGNASFLCLFIILQMMTMKVNANNVINPIESETIKVVFRFLFPLCSEVPSENNESRKGIKESKIFIGY